MNPICIKQKRFFNGAIGLIFTLTGVSLLSLWIAVVFFDLRDSQGKPMHVVITPCIFWGSIILLFGIRSCVQFYLKRLPVILADDDGVTYRWISGGFHRYWVVIVFRGLLYLITGIGTRVDTFRAGWLEIQSIQIKNLQVKGKPGPKQLEIQGKFVHVSRPIHAHVISISVPSIQGDAVEIQKKLQAMHEHAQIGFEPVRA